MSGTGGNNHVTIDHGASSGEATPSAKPVAPAVAHRGDVPQSVPLVGWLPLLAFLLSGIGVSLAVYAAVFLILLAIHTTLLALYSVFGG